MGRPTGRPPAWLRLACACWLLAGCGAGTRAAKAPAAAQPRAATPTELARMSVDLQALAQPLIDDGVVHGMVVGVIAPGGKRIVRAFGQVVGADGAPVTPDANTRFEAGSLTKVFTATLLARAWLRGDVRPADRLDRTLGLPDRDPPAGDPRQPVTLADLASHASDFPRLPADFKPADPSDPYADFKAGDLRDWLARQRLLRPALRSYRYSNLGVATLGLALAQKLGVDYAAAVRAQLLSPLGMVDSDLGEAAEGLPAVVQGHDADGGPVPPWHLGAFAPAGGLRTTAGDLLRFVAAQLHAARMPDTARAAERQPVHAAMRLTWMPRLETRWPPGWIALGWHILPNLRTRWHNGRTGGHHAFVAFDPEEGRGVVVLADTATALVDQLGAAVLAVVAGKPPLPLTYPKAAPWPEDRQKACIGRFAQDDAGVTIGWDAERKRLSLALPANQQVALRPMGEDRYFTRISDERVRCLVPKGGGAAPAVIIELGDGQAWRLPRQVGVAPAPDKAATPTK
jgi:CubicO group peptidase (beta-lactamase class C family)